MGMTELGWHPFFEQHFEAFRGEGLAPMRIVREERAAFLVSGDQGDLTAEVSGRFRHHAQTRSDFPAVGDWVAVAARPDESRATIHAVLPRRSAFSRKVAGATTEEQVVAANIDTVFLVNGLDGGRNFNLRRIERYLALTWESGAAPVVVLNKTDLCDDVDGCIAEAESVATGVPIHPVSATERQGMDALQPYLAGGKTVALLGSSGVGKSTSVNALLGAERQDVGAIREGDGRGRHTTTCRELILLPDGAALIDTPGLRELQLWTDEESLDAGFEDIEAIASGCRFRDCRHEGEPGCAVHEAIGQGRLEASRFESYLQLRKELENLAARQNQRASMVEKAKWRKIAQLQRRLKEDR